jgi:hypothetical protein
MSFYLVRSVRTGKPIAYIEARDEQHAIARAGLVHHRVKFPQDELLAAQPAGSERRCCVQFPDRYFRVYDDVDAKDHRGSL